MNKTMQWLYNNVRLIARILGLIVCSFFTVFMIGEGIPDIKQGKGYDLIPFLPLLIFSIVSYIVAWFKEIRGGYMLIIGGASMFLYHIMQDFDVKMALVYGVSFAFIGILFLIHGFKFEKESMK